MAIVAKVLKRDDREVSLGFDDGTFQTIYASDIGFPVNPGDRVEVFVDEAGHTLYSRHDLISGIPLEINYNVHTGKKAVNKIAYIVCALLLGGFGIHKFIAGKTMMGILYLALCWTFLPSLIGFIEGIFAIFKDADAHGYIYI